MKATWGRKLFSFLNKFVGVILFLICAWAIYQKVLHHPNLQAHGAEIQNQFKRISIIQWGLLIFLFLMNYTTEAMKWKILLAHWNPLSILKSLKIVLVGQAFAFFTPVRSGDYVGRILFLDAGNNRSYSGTGITWTDLSSTAITGSLTNGPTFSSANGGGIVFDGTNDYVNLGS
ncbi:MAG: hypothetical protein EBV82_04635, partial [Chitinophagia bacterium]|nr:hypothetical protein [Chitinophagia bacterium]